MKIDSTYKPASTAVSGNAASRQQAAPAPAQDAVSLSQWAGTLHGMEQQPVNTARIQEIKQAISEGRFKINPDAIADRLLESARDLVSKSSNQRQA